ncbi:PREDICTED: uncharacterized protein LOC106110383 isoform X1 [Papilio polytes]|uniref:uncharacterized protein LOC106110383 isoform X1 n=1 Tax=Papilio polytes TaxID=76194 RepID=UPI000675CE1C|nr:PREDICTED: uncharacterized protein LOC106110383 isoform X1 [Papilio polytes]
MYKVRMVLFLFALVSCLFVIDCVLGNVSLRLIQSFSENLQTLPESVKEETKVLLLEGARLMNLPLLCSEVLFLAVMTVVLNNWSSPNKNDRIDRLLQESRRGLQSTNTYLEKWRQKRVQAEENKNKEPDYVKPLKLEVPILHMAIIDNRATNRFDARAQHERGDAGDSINITDTTLLSVASVNNDDFESIMKLARDDVTTEDIRSIETNNRYLWKVLEEDDDDI